VTPSVTPSATPSVTPSTTPVPSTSPRELSQLPLSSEGSLGGSFGNAIDTSPISGSLNSIDLNSIAPPSDASAGNSASPPPAGHEIPFNGTYNLSQQQLGIDALTLSHLATQGGFDPITPPPSIGYSINNITLKGTLSDNPAGSSDDVNYDNLVFSDSENYIHTYPLELGPVYSPNDAKFYTHSQTTLAPFNKADFDLSFGIENYSTSTSLSVSIAGVSTEDIDINFDPTSLDFTGDKKSIGNQLVERINADSQVIDAGIKAAWYWDDSSQVLRLIDPQGQITSAKILSSDGSNAIGILPASISQISWGEFSIVVDIDGVIANGGDTDYFTPGHLHGSEFYNITNTNIGRYEILHSELKLDRDYALSGASDPDFVLLEAGINDNNSLSFFNKQNPSNGDGDYNLLAYDAINEVNNYEKIKNIEILDARGYGTNEVSLNAAAIRAMTEEGNEATFLNTFATLQLGNEFHTLGEQIEPLIIANDFTPQYYLDNFQIMIQGVNNNDSIIIDLSNIAVDPAAHKAIYDLRGSGWVAGDVVNDLGTQVAAAINANPIISSSGVVASWNNSELNIVTSDPQLIGGMIDNTGSIFGIAPVFKFDSATAINSVSPWENSGLGFNWSSITNNQWALSISGDSTDSLVLSDENNWIYNGIVDQKHLYEAVIDSGSSTDTEYRPPTRIEHSNLLYQLKTINGGETYFLNFSASFGNHPDWYWTGTSADEAFELPDLQLANVDFKDGFDTLELDSGLNNNTYRFDLLTSGLSNVEVINLTNDYDTISYTTDSEGNTIEASRVTQSSADTATFDKNVVIQISDTNNTLNIIGDSIDSIILSDAANNWTYLGTEVSSLNTGQTYTFNQYTYKPGTSEAVTLNIETEIATNIGTYYRGWEGNDVLELKSASFDGITGDSGFDILKLDYTGIQNLDLSGQSITGIELLDMRNTNNDAVTFDLKIVDGADSDIIHVLGEAGNDSVNVAGSENWTLTGRANYDDIPDMYVYQSSNGSSSGSLYVQTDLLQNLYSTPTGTAADDTLWLLDSNFGILDAGNGFDRLVFAQSGDIDLLNNGTDNRLINSEAIDTTNGEANNLSIGVEQVKAMNSDNELYVLGDSNDSLELTGWTKGASTTMTNLTWDSYTSTASGGENVTVYVDSQINTTT